MFQEARPYSWIRPPRRSWRLMPAVSDAGPGACMPPDWWREAERAVRPVAVVMVNEGSEHALKVAAVDDQQPVATSRGRAPPCSARRHAAASPRLHARARLHDRIAKNVGWRGRCRFLAERRQELRCCAGPVGRGFEVSRLRGEGSGRDVVVRRCGPRFRGFAGRGSGAVALRLSTTLAPPLPVRKTDLGVPGLGTSGDQIARKAAPPAPRDPQPSSMSPFRHSATRGARMLRLSSEASQSFRSTASRGLSRGGCQNSVPPANRAHSLGRGQNFGTPTTLQGSSLHRPALVTIRVWPAMHRLRPCVRDLLASSF